MSVWGAAIADGFVHQIVSKSLIWWSDLQCVIFYLPLFLSSPDVQMTSLFVTVSNLSHKTGL